MPAAQPVDSTSLAFPTLPVQPAAPTDGSSPGDSEEEPPFTFETTATTAPDVSAGDWLDITGNLVGLESECGNVSFVSAHPTLDQVIVGIGLHGLWSLAPEANGWLPLGTGDGSDEITNRMGAAAYDPEDPFRFWESGYYAFGVFETRDGGATFSQLGSVDHIDVVSVDFADPQRSTLLAGGHERTALFLSTDGGDNWLDIGPNLPPDVGFASNPAVIDANTFLLGTSNADNAGLFRSVDAGATWTKVFDAPMHGTPVIEGDTIAWLTTGGTLAVSTDGGATFEQAAGATAAGRPSLVRLPDGRLAALGERSIVISADLGATWREVGPPLPYEPRGLAYSAERSSFYIWQFSCNPTGGNPVPAQGIMQLEVGLDG